MSTPPPEPAFPWKQPWKWADAAKQREEQSLFAPSRAAELAYERQLRSVAEQVRTALVTTGDPGKAEKLLREYAKLIGPWAQQSAANMILGVQRKNDQAWRTLANRMGLDVRALFNAPGIGDAVAQRIAENAALITSLPLEAANKAAEIAQQSLVTGSRADDLAKRIAGLGDMTLSRARTIARTEVSKAGVALTQARADSVGSEGYIWRTARDGDTRPSHAAMEGKFVRWDAPQTLDNMTGHAGEFPNCRCYPEPVVPREGGGVYRPALPTQGEERNAGEQKLLSQWERTESSPVIRHVAGEPLVNVDRAVFDIGKLTDYSLNPDHASGKHKARVWKAAIGAELKHADMIARQVMAFLPHAEARQGNVDIHGVRFVTMIPVTGPNGKTVDVKAVWIYDPIKGKKAVSTTPRLTTIYVPEDSDAY